TGRRPSRHRPSSSRLTGELPGRRGALARIDRDGASKQAKRAGWHVNPLDVAFQLVPPDPIFVGPDLGSPEAAPVDAVSLDLHPLADAKCGKGARAPVRFGLPV